MNDNAAANPSADTILVAESDVMVRIALAEYLRHCGYRVVEATSADEVLKLLSAEPEITVDVVFSAAKLNGSMDGFGIARWVRTARPGVEVVLAGSVVTAAHKAGELCEKGPDLETPYEPQQVVEWIKKLRNIKLTL